LTEARLNDLSRKKWLKYSISVWGDIKYDSHERAFKKEHPAVFPLQIPLRFIEIFTHKGEWVLDPFSGLGTTLLACKMLARNCYGIDISPEFTKIAAERVSQQTVLSGSPTQQIPICDDSRNLLKHVDKESIDFAVTSPPYWKILREQKTFLKREATPYTDLKGDLGNIGDYDEFVSGLVEVFSRVHEALRSSKFLVVDIMDIRIEDTFYPLHMDLIRKMSEIGFSLWDIIVWDRHGEYNNLRAMAYASRFYVNKVHEYLLIFQNRERKSRENQLGQNRKDLSTTRQMLLFPRQPFTRDECANCQLKKSAYCHRQCPYNVWRK